MSDIELMREVKCDPIVSFDLERFPSVILASGVSDGKSEILVEYACEYDRHTFLRWSVCLDSGREWFEKKCNLCGEHRECMAFNICEFDNDPFSSPEECLFRDSGVTIICRGCANEAEESVESAAKEYPPEFVASQL